MNHLPEVANLVAEANNRSDPNMIIVALLQYAIEDEEVPQELLAGKFGERVVSIAPEQVARKAHPQAEVSGDVVAKVRRHQGDKASGQDQQFAPHCGKRPAH